MTDFILVSSFHSKWPTAVIFCIYRLNIQYVCMSFIYEKICDGWMEEYIDGWIKQWTTVAVIRLQSHTQGLKRIA